MGETSLTEITCMSVVDSLFTVHRKMRSFTGGLLSFGIGAVQVRSKTSEINVESATESELVSTSAYLPHNLWMRHFMIAKDYEIKDSVIFKTVRAPF